MGQQRAEQEDMDVAAERLRVRQGGAQTDLLRVCDLTKVIAILLTLTRDILLLL